MAWFSIHILALACILLGLSSLSLAYQPSSDVERREFFRRVFGTTAFTVTVGTPPRVVEAAPWPFVDYKGDKSDSSSSDDSDSEDEGNARKGNQKEEDTSESSDIDDEAEKQ